MFGIPVAVLVLGVLYARTLDAFAGIGMVVLTLIATTALTVGLVVYKKTLSLVPAIIAMIASVVLIFFLIRGGVV